MTQQGTQSHESDLVNIFLVTRGYSAQKRVLSSSKLSIIYVDYSNRQSETWSEW